MSHKKQEDSLLKKLVKAFGSSSNNSDPQKSEASTVAPGQIYERGLHAIRAAQYELISYFAEDYKAKKHNKAWFVDRFDSEFLDVATLYDYYQHDKKRSGSSCESLFSAHLFTILQNTANFIIARQEEPKERREKAQECIAVCFMAARLYAHREALMNGYGTAEKQARHMKEAAEALESLIPSHDGATQNQESDAFKELHDFKLLAFPGTPFKLPRDVQESFVASVNYLAKNSIERGASCRFDKI